MFARCSAGAAGLTLIDEDDILESGIEIIAQPPGSDSRTCSCCRAARRP